MRFAAIRPVGGGQSQILTVTATSSNPALIPNPRSPTPTPTRRGTVSITPVPNASGTAVITVTVMDNGGTANGGVNSVSQSFTVTVTPVNQAPTLDADHRPRADPREYDHAADDRT